VLFYIGSANINFELILHRHRSKSTRIEREFPAADDGRAITKGKRCGTRGSMTQVFTHPRLDKDDENAS
jgi:hypothetical protein